MQACENISMKTLDTIAGKTYVVTSPNGCTVTDETDLTLGTVEAGQQKVFVATGAKMQADDDSARITATFNAAPALGFGGGVEIKFDSVPKSGSKNAVTSGGLYDALYSHWVKLGRSSFAGSYAVAIGDGATTDTGSIAIGKGVSSKGGDAVCLGAYTQTKGRNSAAIGKGIKVTESGVAVVGAWTAEDDKLVQLYIIAPGSPLANTYENGAACLGYVAKDKNGNVLECGTRKLSELLTNNTAFAPAALDLDAPAPTPFLPTGIMEPIEFPENLTE